MINNNIVLEVVDHHFNIENRKNGRLVTFSIYFIEDERKYFQEIIDKCYNDEKLIITYKSAEIERINLSDCEFDISNNKFTITLEGSLHCVDNEDEIANTSMSNEEVEDISYEKLKDTISSLTKMSHEKGLYPVYEKLKLKDKYIYDYPAKFKEDISKYTSLSKLLKDIKKTELEKDILSSIENPFTFDDKKKKE